MTTHAATVELEGAAVVAPSGQVILAPTDLRIEPGEHWAVLGPNGSGKTTILSLLATLRHPTNGTVRLLGHEMGRIDVFQLRKVIGHVDRQHEAAESMTTYDVVMSGCTGTRALMLRWSPTPEQHWRAEQLAAQFAVDALLSRWWLSLSAGERARVVIVRALMSEPELLLLDEAAAGLDLQGREQLVYAVDSLIRRRPTLTTVSVTHHIEELLPSTSHVLLLRAGSVIAAGPIEESLTSGSVSAAFDLPVEVTRLANGRWSAAMKGRFADA